jgi:hypothetical protein
MSTINCTVDCIVVLRRIRDHITFGMHYQMVVGFVGAVLSLLSPESHCQSKAK